MNAKSPPLGYSGLGYAGNALVTGGSSGIGAAIAEALAATGYRVIVLGRDPERLDALARRIGARALVADLSTSLGLSRAAVPQRRSICWCTRLAAGGPVS